MPLYYKTTLIQIIFLPETKFWVLLDALVQEQYDRAEAEIFSHNTECFLEEN